MKLKRKTVKCLAFFFSTWFHIVARNWIVCSERISFCIDGEIFHFYKVCYCGAYILYEWHIESEVSSDIQMFTLRMEWVLTKIISCRWFYPTINCLQMSFCFSALYISSRRALANYTLNWIVTGFLLHFILVRLSWLFTYETWLIEFLSLCLLFHFKTKICPSCAKWQILSRFSVLKWCMYVELRRQ